MAKVLLLVFSLLFVIEGSVSINGTLESDPLSVNGVLTACAGQQISLTCSHNNLVGITIWKGGPRLNCVSAVGHVIGSGDPPPCGPFIFQGITSLSDNPTVLSSTAVANTTVNINNATIDCIAGNSLSSPSVGNISLCIVAPPTNITCQSSANELNVTWEPVFDATSSSCARSNLNYSVSVMGESDMMVSFFRSVPVTENIAVLANTTEQDPSARYLITLSVDITGDTCMGQQVNVTCETPTEPPASQPTSSTSRELSAGAIAAIVVVVIVLIIVAVVIVIVVVIVIRISPQGKRKDQNGVHDSQGGEQQVNAYAMIDKSTTQ